jgi:type II secretory pathway pseudopilin PulG
MRIRLRQGHTLIEMLLYVALFVILFTFLTDIILNMLDGKTRLEAVNEVTQATREGMTRMELAIRNAASVTTPAAGSTSSSLVLATDVAATNPTTFFVTDGVLRMQEGTSAAVDLTGDGVAVQSLLFRNFGATGAPGSIRIELSVSSTNAEALNEGASGQPVYGSATVRKRL